MSKFIDTAYSALARTRSGNSYQGHRIATHTHMHDISAELAALLGAVYANDVQVERVESVAPQGSYPSPLVLKILADHCARTGVSLHYLLKDPAGQTIFETEDVGRVLPGYISPGSVIPDVISRTLSPFCAPSTATTDEEIVTELRLHAIQGVVRNFPKYASASGYGAAVRTDKNNVYFGGQYSAFDQRLGIHAEMGVLTQALLASEEKVTHIGIASSKFPDSPASPCGCCRQFISEAAAATGSSPAVHLFASETNAHEVYSLDELLPVQWTNEKWQPHDHSFQ